MDLQIKRLKRAFFSRNAEEGFWMGTAAVKALVSWVVQRSDVSAVVAETLLENIPSQRVLIKAGFKPYESIRENLWWIYK